MFFQLLEKKGMYYCSSVYVVGTGGKSKKDREENHYGQNQTSEGGFPLTVHIYM